MSNVISIRENPRNKARLLRLTIMYSKISMINELTHQEIIQSNHQYQQTNLQRNKMVHCFYYWFDVWSKVSIELYQHLYQSWTQLEFQKLFPLLNRVMDNNVLVQYPIILRKYSCRVLLSNSIHYFSEIIAQDQGVR